MKSVSTLFVLASFLSATVSAGRPKPSAAEIFAKTEALKADKSRYDPSVMKKAFGASATPLDIESILSAKPAAKKGEKAIESKSEFSPGRFSGEPLAGFLEFGSYLDYEATDLYNRTTIPLDTCIVYNGMGSTIYSVNASGFGGHKTFYDPHCQNFNSQHWFQLPNWIAEGGWTADGYILYQKASIVPTKTPHYMGLTTKVWVTNDCSTGHVDMLQIQDNCFAAPYGGFYSLDCSDDSIIYFPTECWWYEDSFYYTLEWEFGGLDTCQSAWKKNSRSMEYTCGGIYHSGSRNF